MDSIKGSNWSEEDLQIGKLLLAAAEMQSFAHDNWTSAQSRHKAMPTGQNHWTRSQMRHGSMLAVRSRPLPDESLSEIAVEVCIRRKKLSEAWSTMQACDPDLWTDICDLYTMIAAVEEDPSKFEGIQYVLDEVEEAKTLMHNAAILSAVETIEAFKQEEWKQDQSPACVRRGSLLMVHDHQSEETPIEARVRHVEHAEAWQKMKSCDKEKWAAACHYHEEQNKSEMAKHEKLDAAVWVLQEFTSKADPSKSDDIHQKAKHAAVFNAPPVPEDEINDPVYQSHKKRLVEAWAAMKEADPKDWLNACKEHEALIMPASAGITRSKEPVRNSVVNHAA
jgi:hypothetical protein